MEVLSALATPATPDDLVRISAVVTEMPSSFSFAEGDGVTGEEELVILQVTWWRIKDCVQ